MPYISKGFLAAAENISIVFFLFFLRFLRRHADNTLRNLNVIEEIRNLSFEKKRTLFYSNYYR